MTIYWAPLLHIYQPPTQEIEILRRINRDCYKPLFSLIDKYDNAKFSLNINGILIEMLYEFGLSDTMELIINLVSDNKIEILGTGKFHPILPLVPQKEALHQIQMNEEVNRKTFGNIWKRTGFFPPEMAISSKIIKLIRNSGYKWVIMSGIACPTEKKSVDWPYDKIYRTSNGLQLFFRDDILSNKISFKKITVKEFIEELNEIFQPKTKVKKNPVKKIDKYIITAMDGETFGHHIPAYEKIFLGKTLDLIANGNDLKLTLISNLDQHFPILPKSILPKESSWSTTYDDILAGVPFALWKHPENNVHKYYWKIMKSLNNLMSLADNLDVTTDWTIENYYNTARWFYDRAICSDTTWWANPLKGMWSPNLVYKGVELLVRASLNAQLALEYAGDDSGEGYFDSISYYHGLLLMELYTASKKRKKL